MHVHVSVCIYVSVCLISLTPHPSTQEWSVLCWICCLTYNLYATVVHQRDTKMLEKYYHIACWTISLLAAVIPLAAREYGLSGTWW